MTIDLADLGLLLALSSFLVWQFNAFPRDAPLRASSLAFHVKDHPKQDGHEGFSILNPLKV